MANSADGVIYLETPEKLRNDNKTYRNLLLPNGLHALLVSDLQETSNKDTGKDDDKKAEIALLLDVGFFSDPTNYHGMAHLLERMILKGSTKYPSQDVIDAHLDKCNGCIRSNTENHYTLFSMKVLQKHVDSCMDYLSDSLKSPLLLPETMVQEREAIENEFRNGEFNFVIGNDKRHQILANYANKDYPHSKLSWGNFKTLKDGINDEDLRRDLVEFFKRHYTAQRMSVCFKATLPLDTMEDLVVRHCSDIPSNYMAGDDFITNNYGDAYHPEFYNEVVVAKTIYRDYELELSWMLPSNLQTYKSKALDFLMFVLESKAEGSLGAYLKERSWASYIIVHPQEKNLFTLHIHLTRSGFEHLDDILAAISAYLKLLSPCRALKPFHDEIGGVAAVSLELADDVCLPAERMVELYKTYTAKYMLTNALHYECDEALIEEIIRRLNELKCHIMVTSRHTYEGLDITYDKKEELFGTEYGTIKMPQKWKDIWHSTKEMPELKLPQLNPFAISNFQLYKCELENPKKLLQSDIGELWLQHDVNCNKPKLSASFSLMSPLLLQSAKNSIMADLYRQLMEQHLQVKLKLANKADIPCEIFPEKTGMRWMIRGYTDKFHLVVDTVANGFVGLRQHITAATFDADKEKLRQTYKDALTDVEELKIDIRESVLLDPHWTLMDKYKGIDDISFEDMLDFAEKYTRELYVKASLKGNYSEELALNVMNSLLATLKCKKVQEPKSIQVRCVQLPQGSHYIRCLSLNKDFGDTVTDNVYSCGPTSVRLEAIIGFYSVLADPADVVLP